MRSRRLTAAVLGLFAWPRPALPEATVLERVLAVVDSRPVLLSDVRLLQRLDGLEAETALERLIEEHLMFHEALRLAQANPSPEEEEHAYASLKQKLAGGFAGEEGALRGLARRQTAILKYAEFRFRPQVRVSEEAVREAYEKEYEGMPSPPPLAEVAAPLRARLEERALGERIDTWAQELRSAADIRYNR